MSIHRVTEVPVIRAQDYLEAAFEGLIEPPAAEPEPGQWWDLASNYAPRIMWHGMPSFYDLWPEHDDYALYLEANFGE